jgi:PAS domain S-box-containing protein
LRDSTRTKHKLKTPADKETDEIARLRAHAAELEQLQGGRRANEEQLLWLAQIVESSEDAIIGKSLEGIVRSWNPAAEILYGYSRSEMIGESMTRLLPPDRPNEESEILRRLARGERVEHFETVRLRKDGTQIHVSQSISPIRDILGNVCGASHIARDITERKQLEEKLRQTQRLESLGVLAGGIAHDFNNLLTGILGNASLACESLSTLSPQRKLLADVVKAAERAADLTRQLLAYSGKGQFVTETANLSQLIEEIVGLIQTSVPRNVQLRLELASDLPPVEGDISQFQQVVMNLIINAAEAIGDKPGTVIVTTAVQNVDREFARNTWGIPDLAPGCYVALEVHDDGCGMNEKTIQKIFDPFFTTKFAGRGLGLSAVMGIVNAHKGALKVYSEPGKGTTFKVVFPATNASEHKPRGMAEEKPELLGNGKILVVDDEEIVRQTARNALEHYGYTVLTAKDGREGVDIFRAAHGDIRLVLLDLTMPVMGGEEALHHLKSIDPTVKVLLSSGFNEVETIRRFTGRGLAGFVQKPYTGLTLLQRVAEVLKGTGPLSFAPKGFPDAWNKA